MKKRKTSYSELATVNAKIASADAIGSDWLARGNEASERGDKLLAQKCYEKSQFWLDRSNELRGNA